MSRKQDIEGRISYLMQPFQANIGGNIHGGEVMKLMDQAAGVVAIRYSKGRVATARIDEVQFLQPVVVGSYVTFVARLVYVGTTSMEIVVTAYIENLFGEEPPKKAMTSYVTMVALSQDGSPKKLEPLNIEGDEMRRLYEEAEIRRANRKRIAR